MKQTLRFNLDNEFTSEWCGLCLLADHDIIKSMIFLHIAEYELRCSNIFNFNFN